MQFGFHLQHQLMVLCDCQVINNLVSSWTLLLHRLVCDAATQRWSYTFSATLCLVWCPNYWAVQMRSHILPAVFKFSDPPLILKYVESWHIWMPHLACNSWDYSVSRLSKTWKSLHMQWCLWVCDQCVEMHIKSLSKQEERRGEEEII